MRRVRPRRAGDARARPTGAAAWTTSRSRPGTGTDERPDRRPARPPPAAPRTRSTDHAVADTARHKKAAEDTLETVDPRRRTTRGTPRMAIAEYTPDTTTGELRSLPIASIIPADDNPRETLTDLDTLAASIRSVGLLCPVLVEDNGDGTYRLVAGSRRLAAAQIAGLAEIPALVRSLDPVARKLAQIAENAGRVALTPIEEGAAYQDLLSLDVDGDTVARSVGRPRAEVDGRLAVFALPAIGPRDARRRPAHVRRGPAPDRAGRVPRGHRRRARAVRAVGLDGRPGGRARPQGAGGRDQDARRPARS